MLVRPYEAVELFNAAVAKKAEHKDRCYQEQAGAFVVPALPKSLQVGLIKLGLYERDLESAVASLHRAWSNEMRKLKTGTRVRGRLLAAVRAEEQHLKTWKPIQEMRDEASMVAKGDVTVPTYELADIGVNLAQVIFQAVLA